MGSTALTGCGTGRGVAFGGGGAEFAVEAEAIDEGKEGTFGTSSTFLPPRGNDNIDPLLDSEAEPTTFPVFFSILRLALSSFSFRLASSLALRSAAFFASFARAASYLAASRLICSCRAASARCWASLAVSAFCAALASFASSFLDFLVLRFGAESSAGMGGTGGMPAEG